MEIITSTIHGTPIWVWILFFFLLKRGFSRTKGRIIHQKSIFIFPLIMLVMTAKQLIDTQFDPIMLTITLIGIICGTGALIIFQPVRIEEVFADGRMRLAGEWWTLGMILAVFPVSYANAAMHAVSPSMANAVHITMIAGLVHGFSNGFSLARLYVYVTQGAKTQNDIRSR